MQRSLLDAERGSASIVDALNDVGLSAEELSGMLPEDQFTILADRLGGIEDPSKKAALSMKIFGRAGSELLPMFNEQSKGIANLRQEARNLGRQMSGEDASAAAALADAMNRVKSIFAGVVMQVGGALAPMLTDLTNKVVSVTSGVVRFVQENRGVIRIVAMVAAGIGGVGVALVGIGGPLAIAGTAVSALAGALGLVLSPAGLAVAAIAGLGFAIFKYTDLGGKAIDWLKDRFGPLVASVKDSVAAISGAIGRGDIETAWQIASDTIEMIWMDATGELQDAWAETMRFFMDVGSATIGALGDLISGLADMLDGILDGYRSVYDSIANATTVASDYVIEATTGVKTVGGRDNMPSAFDSQMGGTADSLRSMIDSMRDVGNEISAGSTEQIRARAEERDAAKKERAARLAELRQRIKTAAESEAAIASQKPQAEQPTSDQPKLADISLELPEMKAPEQVEQPESPGQTTGATATFDATAAMLSFGQGGDVPKQQLKATELVANRINRLIVIAERA
ncbi:MAG: phage tail tape measure protein, partial [Planctomycetota bacterium]